MVLQRGKQAELKVVIEQQIGELSALRQAQARLETQLALLQREVELTQLANKQLQENIAARANTSNGPRRNRKRSI